MNTRPIRTTLDLGFGEQPSFNYESEKDIIYERTRTDPQSGIIEYVKITAQSSTPAVAQGQREIVEAQMHANTFASMVDLLRLIGTIYSGLPVPPPAPANESVEAQPNSNN